MEFLYTFSWAETLQVILIDLILGGDNAVIIAVACQSLPPTERTKGIIIGVIGSVFSRFILIVLALNILNIPFMQISSGVCLLWIGVKILAPVRTSESRRIIKSSSIVSVTRTIVIADVVMSLDNVIAITSVIQSSDESHQLFLLIFGLASSIPIIIWGSTVLLKLIDRHPLLMYISAALLGWIASGMIINDTLLSNFYAQQDTCTRLTTGVLGSILVVLVGLWRAKCVTLSKKLDL